MSLPLRTFAEPDENEDAAILQAQLQRLGKAASAWAQREETAHFHFSDPLPVDFNADAPWQNDEVAIPVGCRLDSLVSHFQLSALERDILLLTLLPEYDIHYGQLFASIHPTNRSTRPSVAIIMGILCCDGTAPTTVQACLLPGGSLLRAGLLTLQQKENDSFSAAVPGVDSALYGWLLGGDTLPSELALYARWLPVPVQPEITPQLTEQLVQCSIESEQAPVATILRGYRLQEQLAAVSRAMERRSRSVLCLDLAHLTGALTVAAVQKMLQLAIRETRLYQGCLAIYAPENIVEHFPLLWDWLAHELRYLAGPVVFLTHPSVTLPRLAGFSQVVIAMPVITADDTLGLWARQLSGVRVEPALDITALLNRFNPDSQSIPQLIREATLYQRLRAVDDTHAVIATEDLRYAFQLHAQQSYGKLAQRYTPVRTFDDVVIDEATQQHLQEILAAVRQRDNVLKQGFDRKVAYGTGISTLFFGDSGTGKTMVAEVLAGALGVDLIKIDLSAVVNKYIGETEKNLARIFDIAEQDAGVLFFDEADALFGKRSEVTDAKDRNANIEVAYLLQRLEGYPGLVILATNNRNHLDAAFARRLTFILRFPFPDVALRERMWRVIWPANVSLAKEIDFHLLAQRAEMTGANIRNAALLASWLAAEEGDDQVQLHHLERAIKRELVKVGRVLRF